MPKIFFLPIAILFCLTGCGQKSPPRLFNLSFFTDDPSPIEFQYRDGGQPGDEKKVAESFVRLDKIMIPYFGKRPSVVVGLYKQDGMDSYNRGEISLQLKHRKKTQLPNGEIEETVLEVEEAWLHEYAHAYFEAALVSAHPKWRDIKHVVRPYSELFADIVGVTMLGDGKAFSKLEEMAGGNRGESNVRDFTLDHSFENLPRLTSFDAWYGLLVPTRGFIWKKLVERRSGKNFNKGKFIREIYLAMEAEIGPMISDGKGINRDPKDLNLRLMESLKGL